MNTDITKLTRRKSFAALAGMGAAYFIPAWNETVEAATTCTLSTPQVTEGPYWVDERLFRSDIRTDPTTGVARTGTPLALAITVINSSASCAPLVGAYIDIWHCDAKGIYSDESTYNPGGGTGNVSTTGQKFLRGYQLTDSNGQVNFTTIYPGWYSGRTIHIHVRVRTYNGTTALTNYTTQIFFDETTNNTVLAGSAYSRTSSRDTTNARDMVYNVANNTLMLATLTASGSGYIAAITIDLAASTSTSTFPTVAPNAIVNAASGATGLSPGSWASIFGTNLASSNYSLAASDVVASTLPTTLQNVSVKIDGQAAFLDYVSPEQINVLVPSDSNTGSVSISVTNSNGSSSAVTATMQAILPGLFTQGNYVTAVRPSDGVIINGTGAAVSGYTTVAGAAGGDILEIYGTGFGPTTTPVTPGLVFTGAYLTSNTVTVTIGGVSAGVLFAGLVGAGLYQINVTVPIGLTVGDNPIVATVGGYSTQAAALLNIATS